MLWTADIERRRRWLTQTTRYALLFNTDWAHPIGVGAHNTRYSKRCVVKNKKDQMKKFCSLHCINDFRICRFWTITRDKKFRRLLRIFKIALTSQPNAMAWSGVQPHPCWKRSSTRLSTAQLCFIETGCLISTRM